MTSVSKKPTVYLHIGYNKTGTSAIQFYFDKHRKFFIKNGLLFPRAGFASGAHYALSASLGFAHKSSPKNLILNRTDLRNDLLKEASKHNPSAILFSSEMFIIGNTNIDTAKEFFRDFDVRIIAFLRRHDYWWESAYAQALKTVDSPPWGNNGVRAFINFHKNKKNGYGNYRFLLDNWAEHFGKENIYVIPYEGYGYDKQNKNIISDILEPINLPGLSVKLPEPPKLVNKSLPANELAYIDFLLRTRIDEATKRKIMKNVLSSDTHAKCQSILSLEERLKLINENQGDYEYISNQYLKNGQLSLFLEPLPDHEENEICFKRPSPQKIIEMTYMALRDTK